MSFEAKFVALLIQISITLTVAEALKRAFNTVLESSPTTKVTQALSSYKPFTKKWAPYSEVGLEPAAVGTLFGSGIETSSFLKS